MNARDVMTTDVVCVGPDATVAEIAGLLLKRGISAVPVIDEGRLIGVVSEGDLIRRVELGTERHRSPWLRLLVSDAKLAREYTRSHAATARDVMTREVIAVAETTPCAEIADTLERRRIKRVPVVADGRVVGIVSRADLIRGLAAAAVAPLRPAPADDEAIRRRLVEELNAQPWASIGPDDVIVENGVVELHGVYASEDERRAARVAAENVAGLGRVRDRRIPMPETFGFA